MPQDIRVGLIGAGFIASWHAGAVAAAPNARVTAVCDLGRSAAEAVARQAGDARVFTDAAEMLAADICDAVHILPPPQTHYRLAAQALDAGKHVLVEKPFTLDASEAHALVEKARGAARVLAVNHNFLGIPAYERMRQLKAHGAFGPLDSIDVNWRFPLVPLRSGPFGLWMLREPINLLLELGPHLFAFVNDLAGEMSDIEVRVSKPIEIPGGITHHQHWQVTGLAGPTAVTLNLSLVEGHDDRSVFIRGVTGAARLDYANDTLEVHRANNAEVVLSPLLTGLGGAVQKAGAAMRNAARQTLSLNRAQPYALGIRAAARAFYDAIAEGRPIDPRFDGARGAEVTDMIAAAAEAAAPKLAPMPERKTSDPEPPTALVIGGTGFIGRYLVDALVADGQAVRVLSRGRPQVFDHHGAKVSVFQGDLKDPESLRAAMDGIETVYHLAKADEATWEAYVQNDVEVTRAIAEAALDADVERFVYTGTIDSYDASDPQTTITEDTGADADIERRNLYARSKAACEALLQGMATDKGLPLVIARPGIVIGRGGPLQHWGIGRWQGAGAVKIWGKGDNVLPFVLVEDVADGLVRLGKAPGIEGESFNLIGEPMLSARDYFGAIRTRLGADINVTPGSVEVYYASDVVKYGLKRYAGRMTDLKSPAYRDWKSRTQSARFANDKAKERLGWRPEADREAFLRKAVDEANLFGYGGRAPR
jgi:predicted dehydrogenase/uncharacterized protein YbjT (DUF2867 family)